MNEQIPPPPSPVGQQVAGKPHLRLHCRLPSSPRCYAERMGPDDRQWRVDGPCIQTHWHRYSGNAIKKAQYHFRQQLKIAKLSGKSLVSP